MTVVIALTYVGGAVVASDSRRMDRNVQRSLFVASEHFPKVFRRDWDHPNNPPGAVVRLVIGGIAGQVMNGDRRLTSEIENACSRPRSRISLVHDLCQKLSDQTVNGWIVQNAGIDVVLVATPNLDYVGNPEIVPIHKAPTQTNAQQVTLTTRDRYAIGSGAQAINGWLNQQQWSTRSDAMNIARTAVERAIAWSNSPVGCGGCGGDVCLEMWPT